MISLVLRMSALFPMPGKCISMSSCSDVSADVIEGPVMCFSRVNEILVSEGITTDDNECAGQCNALEACSWFTYNSEDHSCVLTSDREFISNCRTCTYGHSGCTQDGSSGIILSLSSRCSSSAFRHLLKSLSKSHINFCSPNKTVARTSRR